MHTDIKKDVILNELVKRRQLLTAKNQFWELTQMATVLNAPSNEENNNSDIQEKLDTLIKDPEETTETEVLNDEDDETDEDDEDDDYVTITDVLDVLRTFASQNLKVSTLLPLDLLPDEYKTVIEPTVRRIEELLEVPEQKFFIKAVFNRNGFQDLRVPDLALYKGKISMIWHGSIISVEQVFSKILKVKGAKPLSFEIDDNRVYLRFVHPQDSTTRAFRFNVYTREFKTTDSTRIDPVALEQFNYLKKALVEYTFDTSYLEDGRHEVTEWTKKGNFFVVKLGDDRDFYLPEYHVKNLEIAKSRKKPLALVVDGTNDKGFKNLHVEGFPRAIKLSELITQLAGDLGYTISDKEPFPEPIRVPILGVTETEATDNYPASFVLTTEVNGKAVNFKPNTTITKAYNNGMFKLSTFDGVYMIVLSTGTYVKRGKDANNNPTETSYMSVYCNWEIPAKASKISSSFDKMRNALKL